MHLKGKLGSFGEFTQVRRSFKSIITMKEALLRFTVCSFSGQTHFQWSARGTTMIASKLLSTQCETLLIVSPGSLHMNTNIKSIVCEYRVY